MWESVLRQTDRQDRIRAVWPPAESVLPAGGVEPGGGQAHAESEKRVPAPPQCYIVIYIPN